MCGGGGGGGGANRQTDKQVEQYSVRMEDIKPSTKVESTYEDYHSTLFACTCIYESALQA